MREIAHGGVFLYHRKLRKIGLAVLPRLASRKATIGEQRDAGTARFFMP